MSKVLKIFGTFAKNCKFRRKLSKGGIIFGIANKKDRNICALLFHQGFRDCECIEENCCHKEWLK